MLLQVFLEKKTVFEFQLCHLLAICAYTIYKYFLSHNPLKQGKYFLIHLVIIKMRGKKYA